MHVSWWPCVNKSTLFLDIHISPFKDFLNILLTSMCSLLLCRTRGSLKWRVAVTLDQCRTLRGTTRENIWCQSAPIRLAVSMDTGLLRMKLRQAASFAYKDQFVSLTRYLFLEWILYGKRFNKWKPLELRNLCLFLRMKSQCFHWHSLLMVWSDLSNEVCVYISEQVCGNRKGYAKAMRMSSNIC